MKPARYMCVSSGHRCPLPNSALHGSTSTARPSSSRNPDGLFIHALTAITNSEPVKPAITTGMPHSRCSRGDMRSQP